MTKYIAVDLGTTLIKCVLFDENGKSLAAKSMRCTLDYPKPLFAEQDVEPWYEGVCKMIRSLLEGIDPAEVAGLSVSSQGISVVPVDEAFHPLGKAISWLDGRGEEENKLLKEAMSESEWFKITGRSVGGWTITKLLWYKKYQPELFSQTYKFLLPMDYVNARMTGNAVTDHTLAAGTMCYDVLKGDWSDEILKLIDCDRKKLSKIQDAGTLVGLINKETQQLTGLPATVKIFNGAQDQKIAAYGADINEHRVSLSLGTAGAMEVFVERPQDQSALPFFPYVTSEKFLVECCVSTTGAAIQWLKDTLCKELDFAEMNQLAKETPIGSGGVRFYPHLGKPGSPHVGRNEYGSIHGISLSVGRGALIRSLYEGIAFEFRMNLESARSIGSQVQEMVVFGGASKSEVFCQIIADVTGLPLQIMQNSEMGSIGAAKFVANGLGCDGKSFAKAAAGDVRSYQPDQDAYEQYDKLYKKYAAYYV